MTTTEPRDVLPDPAVEPTISVERAGALLGLGRSSAYMRVRSGELPALRLGRRLVVPTARVLAMLGLYPDPGPPSVR